MGTAIKLLMITMFLFTFVAPWVEFISKPKWYVAALVFLFNVVQTLAFIAVLRQYP